jgi:hypothetical protein
LFPVERELFAIGDVDDAGSVGPEPLRERRHAPARKDRGDGPAGQPPGERKRLERARLADLSSRCSMKTRNFMTDRRARES